MIRTGIEEMMEKELLQQSSFIQFLAQNALEFSLCILFSVLHLKMHNLHSFEGIIGNI